MKLIIFDIDSTLCYSKYIDDICFITAFEKVLQIKIPNTDWNNYKHVSDRFIIQQIIWDYTGVKCNLQTMNKVIDAYVNELEHHLSIEENGFKQVAGANALLAFLENDNEYEIGIATGGFSKSAFVKLNKSGINISNIQLYGSDNFSTKPDMIKASITDLQKKYDKSFEKIIYVGDIEYDYRSAIECQIEFIGIDSDRNGKLKTMGIESVIDNFDPIDKFLNLI